MKFCVYTKPCCKRNGYELVCLCQIQILHGKFGDTRLLLLKTKLAVVDSSYFHLNRYQKNLLREKHCQESVRMQDEEMIVPLLVL